MKKAPADFLIGTGGKAVSCFQLVQLVSKGVRCGEGKSLNHPDFLKKIDSSLGGVIFHDHGSSDADTIPEP